MMEQDMCERNDTAYYRSGTVVKIYIECILHQKPIETYYRTETIKELQGQYRSFVNERWGPEVNVM